MMKILNADFDATYELYTVSCDVMKSSPKMLFTIGGAELFVESFEYILDVSFSNITFKNFFILERAGQRQLRCGCIRYG